MEPKLFSVAIVTYNQKKFIMECIDSVLKQDYPKLELIICDDYSCDFDEEYIRKHIDEKKKDNLLRLTIYRQSQNVGTVKNCNTAAKLAQGAFLKLISADDRLYEKNTLSRISDCFINPKVNIISTRARGCKLNGEITDEIIPSDYDYNNIYGTDSQRLFEILSTGPWNLVFSPAVFWRTDFLRAMEYFDENWIYTEDWPMWLEITRKGFEISFYNIISVLYRYNGTFNMFMDVPSPLRKIHFEECAKALREKALPVLKKRRNIYNVLKCKYSIENLKYRYFVESEWTSSSFKQKLKYKTKEFLFLWYVRSVSSLRSQNLFAIRKQLFALVFLNCLTFFSISSLLNRKIDSIIAWISLLVFVSLAIKIVANIFILFYKDRSKNI